MYIITAVTIAVTVTDTNRVITQVIAIAAPVDNEFESKQTICKSN